MKKLPIYILLLVIITCSKDSSEDTSSVYVAPPTNTTNTPSTTVIQYTITVSAGEGGSVSTTGGTYNDGTSISITAISGEGYGFIGWNGSDSTSSTISVTLTANTTIEALFGQLPQLTLPNTPSKVFTKGVGDTLSIGFSHAGGYKTTSLSAEYGSVSVISEPNEGDTEGNVVIEYTVNTVENVDWTRTIAGTDNIGINFIGLDNLATVSEYQVRTQPEPVYKDYLKPSHDLFATRNRVDLNIIRYINERDNSFEVFCSGDETNYFNSSGNYFDELDGVAYADFNGDGYDDIILHPTYTTYRHGGFSTVKMEYELYLYEDGEYKYTEIDWGGKNPPDAFLARKIIVGDYDNDGDPDIYSVNIGLDIPPYTGEPSLFIINNYNINESFDYKFNDLVWGAHSAASADIDGDGDLDIFSVGPRDESPQRTYVSKFLRNDGNFSLSIWEDIFSSNNHPFWSFKSSYQSELIDVDKDGNIDLVDMGHEWDYMYNWCTDNGDGTCGRGKIYWGDEDAKFNEERKSLIPIVRNFGTSTDIDIIDLDNDGVNEIIITRTGGDIDSFGIESDNMNDNFSYSNGSSYFYGGHYIQINKLNSQREILDVTSDFIENNVNNNALQMCSPEDGWFFHTRVEDYEGDGTLNIFNSLVSYRVQHIWEWNGSKFVKTAY